MKKLFLLFTLVPFLSFAQKTELKEGDLIFQNLNCGPLCDAINEVTFGYNDNNFNHIGMVINHEGKLQVIEATHPEVCITPLDEFLDKSPNPSHLGRINKKYRKLIEKAKEFSLQQVGVPYDENYLLDNGKYYCSELLYDAFKYANNGKSFFYLFAMTYKSKHTEEFFPVWVEYFENLNQPIPEGLPGLNPAGMSYFQHLTMLGAIER
ncbi:MULTISPECIES: YiiX/YebB-like N1pC/P60 family cysteine hydrolase [Myroides]|uniref:Permuted papain-like amidase enzyme, YaeF/YiiX, C92 family n=1 Tax=Myroides albus TaxID=2562892 RepID=A0A6I3LL18_9FLAO|nr:MULTISPECIES: YiiX/YebB-like N1pC/P60 family cysteine hydrolase [Myroides]MTG96862.1 hypothetical protein [Myroides albus]MVX36514.1 hypothetical protein [Myroides sp. LoEW2-1]UVD78388.1 YiiX/YebB-like N1pC/P60 family cysteine hydrolase [Myroides albus]